MTKKRTILTILALLVFVTVGAQNSGKNDGMRTQKYVYRTSEDRINAAIDSAFADKDSLFSYKPIVLKAVKDYIKKKKIKFPQGKPNDVKVQESVLSKRIKEVEDNIKQLTPDDIQKPEPVNRMTVQEIEKETAKLNAELQKARKSHDSIQDANKIVRLKNAYMANYPCVVEKTLEEYLNEADMLMKGRYNANKNKELAEVLSAKSKKRNDDAAKKAQQLEDEEKAYVYFRESIWPEIIEYVIPLRDRDYLDELRNKNFKKRYGDRYPIFYDAFDQVLKILDNKNEGNESLDDILEQIKETDQ